MRINVTSSFLPPFDEYTDQIANIWKGDPLTNNGPLLLKLEAALRKKFALDHAIFVSNGTIALQIAIKALNLSGEIITTPFSYIATTSSIVWENCTPIMVDIDPETLNIDPTKIEAAITEKTTAIMATHVYGNACDVDAIQLIAQKHNLKVIYDAAHAFGSTINGKSLFSYGDIATTSFHATKIFHTIEGGAMFTNDNDIAETIKFMRNFGQKSPTEFATVGINGKNSEFHAAMGLCNLKYFDMILKNRIAIAEHYYNHLKGCAITFPKTQNGCTLNYSYFPVVFETETALLKTMDALNQNNIYPRRYFYPSLSDLPYLLTSQKEKTPVANDISKRVLCLPMYSELAFDDVSRITKIIYDCAPQK